LGQIRKLLGRPRFKSFAMARTLTFWRQTMLEPPHAPIAVSTASPIAKVNNPAIVAAIATVLVWIAKQYFKLEIPADVAIAGVGALSFIVAYYTPLKRREISP
jgi:hypothetical protein